MKRVGFAILSLVAAAAAVFAVRFVSDTKPDSVVTVETTGRLSERPRSSYPGPGDSPSVSAGRVEDARRQRQPSEPTMSGPRQRSAESGGQGVPGGAAGTIRGTARRRGSVILGASREANGRNVGGASRASIADSTETNRVTSREKHRDELVELLGSLPPSEKQRYAGGDAGDESGGDDQSAEDGDVALHLPLEKDVQAEQSAPVEESGIEPAKQGEGMTFTEDAVLAFPDAGNATGNGGTISLEIEPQWQGSDETNNAFVNIRSENQFENRLQLVKNGRYLRFLLADNTGQETGVGLTISAWQPGERHRVAATWGDGTATLYVDGQLIGQTTYQGQLVIPPGTPMFVGSDHQGGYSGANATLRDLTVYRRSLGPDEILSR